jgi:polar amino acid transport system substrate-binding protein
MRLFRSLLPCLYLALQFSVSAAHAQTATEPKTASSKATLPTLRIATRVVPPFVIDEAGRLEGFSIDLWNAIAQELGVKSRYVTTSNVKDLLAAIKAGRAEVGIAAISITSEREKSFDFSQPMFDAGLQVMVRDQKQGGDIPSPLLVLLSPAMLQALGIVLLLVLVPAHLVWWIERNHEDGIIERKEYFPGILKAFWWAAGTLGAQADEMPKSPWGRVIALLWMFTGIAFVAYFTAIITASLTVQQLQGDINGPDDLPGKRVATTTGSTSAVYLRERHIQPQEYAQFEDAARALEQGKVQALVFDAPVLLHYTAHQGKGKAHVVGQVFRKEGYGIAFPPGSPWRRRTNYALLKLKEDGTYDRIYNQWFSSE